MKYVLIGWGITVIIAIFLWNIADKRGQEIKSLKIENKNMNNKYEACNEKISKYNSAQEKSAQIIEKVRTVVRTVESDCNCYDVLLPADVRKLLNNK